MTVTKGIIIEIRTVVDLEKGKEIEVIQDKAPNPGVAVYLKLEMLTGDRVEIILETDLNQDPGHLLV